jgi:ABC-type antimicrobial peptide transport system permease subunit
VGDVSSLLKSTVATLDPAQPVKAPIPMETYVTRNLSTSQFQMQTLGLFAGGGLVIASCGLYALLTFLVSASRREWAVRLALGATGVQLRQHVIRQAGLYGISGVVVGLVLYALSSRALAAVTYGTPVWNPWFVLAAALTMIAVCIGAALGPAMRASRIAPREALAE